MSTPNLFEKTIADLLSLDHVAEAMDLCNHMISSGENVYSAYGERGWIRYRSGDVRGAIADAEMQSHLRPSNPTPHIRMAALWIELDRYESALSEVEYVLQTNDEYYREAALFYKSISLHKLHHSTDALEIAEGLPTDFVLQAKIGQGESIVMSRQKLISWILEK